MYSHTDINYKPQHPMLKNQRGYTVEDEGVIKSSLSAAARTISKGAKAVPMNKEISQADEYKTEQAQKIEEGM